MTPPPGGYTLFLWEPNLSPHKLGLYHALKRHPGVRRVVYVAQEGVPLARRGQGWSVSVEPDDEIVYGPDKALADHLVEAAPPDAVHLFSGMRRVPAIVHGLDAVLRRDRIFGLMSEPRASEGGAGLARLAHSWLTEGRLRRKARFVLAIGRNGPAWFRHTGYRASAIFPYAYFLDPPQGGRGAERPRPVTLGFLGRLERLKGLDVLLRAVSLLPPEVALKVAGSGSLTGAIEALQASGRAVCYLGVLSMEQVPDFLADVDILVQPSIVKDGWGAVVSEALFAGAAVVTSTCVGASVCVEQSTTFGAVVSTPSPEAVAKAVEELVRSGALGAAARAQRMVWSRARLSAAAGAGYLVHILDHVIRGQSRPAPYYAEALMPEDPAASAPGGALKSIPNGS